MHRCRTILLVEDDDQIRELLQQFLEAEGHDVAVASNGKEAIELLKKIKLPAFILLDIMMPIMGGKEFIHLIRDDTELAPLPIVVISADADPRDFKKDIHGFLRKPIDLDALEVLVREHCT